jgi:hypothetical protein
VLVVADGTVPDQVLSEYIDLQFRCKGEKSAVDRRAVASRVESKVFTIEIRISFSDRARFTRNTHAGRKAKM